MKRGRLVIRLALVLVGLPLVLTVAAVAAFYARFYSTPRASGMIVSSGQRREFLIHVPPSYDRSRPTPLVISMHAAAMWPAAQMELSRWNKVADENGFIVVYPSGTTLRGGGTGVLPKVWLLGREPSVAANVRFISDLIDRLQANYNIDPTRIYANGFSNGGAMVFVLSCRLSLRIAAVGTVSAAQDQQPWSWCANSRPVPLINFHGTADLVPYEGGKVRASKRPFPGVRDWTASWARRNRCSPQPVETAIAPDVVRLEYANCADRAAVVLFTIRGGGHAWPGGEPMPEWICGRTTRSIDATRLMWSFFREHPLVTD